MLLELLIVSAEVVIDTSRLLFLNKTLVYHVLAPSGMRSIHSDKSFTCGQSDVLDKVSLKKLK